MSTDPDYEIGSNPDRESALFAGSDLSGADPDALALGAANARRIRASLVGGDVVDEAPASDWVTAQPPESPRVARMRREAEQSDLKWVAAQEVAANSFDFMAAGPTEAVEVAALAPFTEGQHGAARYLNQLFDDVDEVTRRRELMIDRIGLHGWFFLDAYESVGVLKNFFERYVGDGGEHLVDDNFDTVDTGTLGLVHDHVTTKVRLARAEDIPGRARMDGTDIESSSMIGQTAVSDSDQFDPIVAAQLQREQLVSQLQSAGISSGDAFIAEASEALDNQTKRETFWRIRLEESRAQTAVTGVVDSIFETHAA